MINIFVGSAALPDFIYSHSITFHLHVAFFFLSLFIRLNPKVMQGQSTDPLKKPPENHCAKTNAQVYMNTQHTITGWF